jgi:hypothetical protein
MPVPKSEPEFPPYYIVVFYDNINMNSTIAGSTNACMNRYVKIYMFFLYVVRNE